MKTFQLLCNDFVNNALDICCKNTIASRTSKILTLILAFIILYCIIIYIRLVHLSSKAKLSCINLM